MFRRAATLLPWLRWSLRLRGYGKTFASLQKRVPPPAKETEIRPGEQEKVQAACRMVIAALRYSFLQYTCLEESLTLWYLLRKQGIAVCLRIGVRKENEKFEAHAWVEHRGEALNQDEETHRHYAAFEEDLQEPPAEQP
jgi:hypothetical protein